MQTHRILRIPLDSLRGREKKASKREGREEAEVDFRLPPPWRRKSLYNELLAKTRCRSKLLCSSDIDIPGAAKMIIN